MALLSQNRIAWTYTADDGTLYRVAAQKALTDQGVLGGADGSALARGKPSGLKMRRTTISDTAGRSRVVPVYEPGAGICTPGTALNVNYRGDQHALTSSGHLIGEKAQGNNVTKQSG